MGKRKAHIEVGTADKPARSPWLIPSFLGLCIALIATLATYVFAAQVAPLGAPVPPPPPAIFTLTEGGQKDSSLIRRNIAKGWLLRLAPQPDGLPHLHQSYHSEKLQFDIRYPYGAQNVEFNVSEFAKDAVDSQAMLRIDQPITAIKVSFASKPQEATQAKFAADLLRDFLKQGASAVDEPELVNLAGGGFTTFAYLRENESGKLVHRLYIASVGARALIFDFMLPPDSRREGDAYAAKIMRSFEAGPMLGPLLEEKPEPEHNETARQKSQDN